MKKSDRTDIFKLGRSISLLVIFFSFTFASRTPYGPYMLCTWVFLIGLFGLTLSIVGSILHYGSRRRALQQTDNTSNRETVSA